MTLHIPRKYIDKLQLLCNFHSKHSCFYTDVRVKKYCPFMRNWLTVRFRNYQNKLDCMGNKPEKTSPSRRKNTGTAKGKVT